VVLVVFAVAAAATGAANVAPSGSLVVRWHSNPQTCAEHGLCDRSGTLSWRPTGPGAGFDVFAGGRRVSLNFFPGSALARSSRPGADGPAVCVEQVPGPYQFDTIGRGRSTRLKVADPESLGFGRCAGPLSADFAAALPLSRPLDPAKLRRGGVVDMRGRKAFAVGPFEGEVVSTLRFRVGRSDGAADPARRARTAAAGRTRVGELTLTYAIEAVRGEATFAFAGAGDPMCEIFDACDLSGELRLGGTTAQGTLTVTATRRLPREAGETVAEALKTLHAGRSAIFADAFFGEEDAYPPAASFPVAETSGFEGLPLCSDSGTLKLSGLGVAGEHNGLTLWLGGSEQAPPDELRTRCPGPTSGDLSARRLVSGVLPLPALGDDRPPLTLRPAGVFSSPAFAGSGHGALDVDLRLVSAEVRTRRPPPPGRP
jgi:hypothetical protein